MKPKAHLPCVEDRPLESSKEEAEYKEGDGKGLTTERSKGNITKGEDIEVQATKEEDSTSVVSLEGPTSFSFVLPRHYFELSPPIFSYVTTPCVDMPNAYELP